MVRKPWVRPAPPQQRINNVIRPSSTYGEGPLLGPLLECDRGRKCLVLDLDETLVHSSFRPVPNPDYILPVEIEGIVHNVYVLKRPGCDEFLYRCGMCYEVVVFTASLAKYADPLLDLLDPHNVIRARLFREACVQHEGSFVKDMSMLGRDPTDVIIVDNSPASYLFQPENALPCDSYIDNPADRELWLLADLLETIQRVVDVRDALQRWVTGTYAGLHGLAVLPPESEVFYVEEEVEVSGGEEEEGEEEDALSGDSEGEEGARADHARGLAECSDADSLAGDGHGAYAHGGGAGADATLELSDEDEATGTGGGGGGPRRHGRGGHPHGHGHGRAGTEGGGVSSVRSSLSSADTGSAAGAGGGYEPGTPAEGTASSAGVHGGRGGLSQEDGGSPAFAHGPGAGLGQPQPQLQPHQSMYRANMPPLQERIAEAGPASGSGSGVPDGARAVNPLARMSAAGAERGGGTRSSTVAGGSSGGPSRAESPVGAELAASGGIANGTVARNAMGGGGGGEAPPLRTSLSLSSAAAGSGAGATPTSSAGLVSSGAGAMPHRPSHSAPGPVPSAYASAAGGGAGVGAKSAAGADDSAGLGAGVRQSSAGRLGSGKHRESEEAGDGEGDEEKGGSAGGGQQQAATNGGHRSRSSSKHAGGGEAAETDAGRHGSHESDRWQGKLAEGEGGGDNGAPPASVTLRHKQGGGSASGAPSASASPSSSKRYITSL